MVHSDEKPFSCNLCDKKFRRKSTLNDHIKVHNGEKMYKCSICEKLFITKVNSCIYILSLLKIFNYSSIFFQHNMSNFSSFFFSSSAQFSFSILKMYLEILSYKLFYNICFFLSSRSVNISGYTRKPSPTAAISAVKVSQEKTGTPHTLNLTAELNLLSVMYAVKLFLRKTN